MDSAYINALETRVRWLRWAKLQGANVWGDIDATSLRQRQQSYLTALPGYVKTLEAGDTFFMNRNFGQLVEHARQSVPDDLVFEHTWLQSPQGWLWIQEPFHVPSIVLDENLKEKEARMISAAGLAMAIRVSAVGWFPVPKGHPTEYGGRVAGEGATEFLCFQDFAQHRAGAEGFGCWSYFMLQNGDRLIDRIRQFEAVASKEGGAYIADRTTDMMHEMRWIYAAMYLMGQRLAVTTHHNTDRATRRRHERAGRIIPPFIRVVSLRRLEEERSRSADHQKVDWQWQWEVRGHWRNQFYPSLGVHKQKFIEAYIKGPESKPLKPPGHKIFVAVR